MIRNKIVLLCLLICLHLLAGAQTPAPVKWLLQAPYMRGASFSLVVKDVQEGRTGYCYGPAAIARFGVEDGSHGDSA